MDNTASDLDRLQDDWRLASAMMGRQPFGIPQDRACIQRFSRPDSGSLGTVDVIEGIEASLPIPSLAVTVPMAEIYAKVDFPPAEALPRPNERNT